MTSATERLRELLDARGVEWRKFTDIARGSMELHHLTYYDSADGYKVRVTSWRDSETVAVTMMVTPEQAIAVTLGAGECEQEEGGWSTEGDHARVWLTCGHDCMVPTVADLPNFCPDCGKAVKR